MSSIIIDWTAAVDAMEMHTAVCKNYTTIAIYSTSIPAVGLINSSDLAAFEG